MTLFAIVIIVLFLICAALGNQPDVLRDFIEGVFSLCVATIVVGGAFLVLTAIF